METVKTSDNKLALGIRPLFRQKKRPVYSTEVESAACDLNLWRCCTLSGMQLYFENIKNAAFEPVVFSPREL